MSDQGERGARWTTTNDDDGPTGPIPRVSGLDQAAARSSEPTPAPGTTPAGPAFPEVEVPEPAGRTEFSAPDFPEYSPYSQPDLEMTENPPPSLGPWPAPRPPQDDDPAPKTNGSAPEGPQQPQHPATPPPAAGWPAPPAASAAPPRGEAAAGGAPQLPQDGVAPGRSAPPAGGVPQPSHGAAAPAGGVPQSVQDGAAPDWSAPPAGVPQPSQGEGAAGWPAPPAASAGPPRGEAAAAGGVPLPAQDGAAPGWSSPPAGVPQPSHGEAAAGWAAQAGDADWQPLAGNAPREGDAGDSPEDVRVAPLPAGGGAWEGSLFGGPDSDGDSDYAPVLPSGPSTPPKPGKPSSGNWRMPEWIKDEEEAAKGGKGGTSAGSAADAGFDEGRRSRLVLFGGVGLLVVALVAAGGAYLMKGGDDEAKPEAPPVKQGRAANTSEPAPQIELPPDRAMPRFPGRPTRTAGRVDDAHAGLSFPRFGAPWQLPTKKNKLGVSGWSGQQIVVTERRPGQIWYGQLLTGTLHPALMSAYQGPESVKTVTALATEGLLQQYYSFPHKRRPLASQALDVGGRKGWLISSVLTYKRPGIKAKGEVVSVAVIDTGGKAPAVVFASVPGTHRKLWPDVNVFFKGLKPLR